MERAYIYTFVVYGDGLWLLELPALSPAVPENDEPLPAEGVEDFDSTVAGITDGHTSSIR